MAGVDLNLAQSDKIRDMMIAMVRSDPDGAVALRIQMGDTEEEAAAFLADIQTSITLFDKKDALKGYQDDIKTAIMEALITFDPTDVEADILEMKTTVKWSGIPAAGSDEAPGFMVDPISIRLKGEEKFVKVSKAVKSSDGNGGTRAKHPVPQELIDAGHKTWASWATESGIDTAGKSAFRELVKAGDAFAIAANGE